jgi:tetratricopeptide (TPR) repeat protein
MPADYLGNAIEGGCDDTLAAIDDFIAGLLGYETRAAIIVEAAERDPESCLANIYAGIFQMLAEHQGSAGAAAPFIATARRRSDHTGPRERLLLHGLIAWAADDIDATVAALEQTLAAWPRDLAALKLLQYHQFNRGDFAGMLHAAHIGLGAAPEVAHVHGMAAFAYEQLHLLDKAETSARYALTLGGREPWAEHALAHVLLTQGRIGEGIVFLEGARSHWTGLNSFMLTHLWWHLALFYLSRGRLQDALAAYDKVVWANDRTYSQDQVGAVSLLARLEFAGVDIGPRWRELGDYLVARAHDVVQPFLSAQYLYGLARADRPEAGILLTAIERRAERDGVWRDAALPLARGLISNAGGDQDRAAVLLAEAVPRLARLGGSHAQRDLFDQILLDATLGAGRLADAQQQLEQRRIRDPDDYPANRSLAKVYAGLGLPEEAAEAELRTRRLIAQ